MRLLYLDCFSGISGDMTVGALCDLGVKPSAFEWELSKLAIGDFHIHWERTQRQNIQGVKFSIHEGATHREEGHEPHHHHHDDDPHHGEQAEPHHHHEEEVPHHDHGHEEHHPHHGDHHHHHHHGRGFREIRGLIEESGLSDFVKRHAVSIFRRIAEAEGRIHGMPPDEVKFHEVGALDSIADIVLACAGVELLKVDRIVAAPLAEGRGWIDSAHGRFPVPAPATLEILKGIPLGAMDEPFEFITPTGAAIVAEFAQAFGPMPAMKIEKIGYGAGTRVLKNRPNVLRAIVGETEELPKGEFETDSILRVETNLDDLSPEIVASATEALLKAGALDVFLTPIQMKKNRPALQLTVLCEEAEAGRLAEVIFRHTSSFGVRIDRVNRLKLPRTFEKVQTPYGEVTVKVGMLKGERIQVAPEYESCRELGEKTCQPVRVIYEAALKAR